MEGANRMKYQLYIVKKFYTPIQIEADSPSEAEEKGYAVMEANSEYKSDDSYIYFEGEA